MAGTRLFNGIEVGREIAFSICKGPCGFTQHVKACHEAFVVGPRHPLARFSNRATHDEDFAHHAHGGTNGLTHKRFACAGQKPTQRAALSLLAHQRTADDKAPGC